MAGIHPNQEPPKEPERKPESPSSDRVSSWPSTSDVVEPRLTRCSIPQHGGKDSQTSNGQQPAGDTRPSGGDNTSGNDKPSSSNKPPASETPSGEHKPSGNQEPPEYEPPSHDLKVPKPEPKERPDKEIFAETFPHGFEVVPTDSDGALCGLYAVIETVKATLTKFPAPTIDELQAALHSEECQATLEIFAMMGEKVDEKNFSPDQIELILKHSSWRSQHNLDIRVGLIERQSSKGKPTYKDPYLVPHLEERSPSTVHIWIHHNGKNDLTAHWSGLRPKQKPSAAKSVIKPRALRKYRTNRATFSS